jgi:sugar diacid utilization regulator
MPGSEVGATSGAERDPGAGDELNIGGYDGETALPETSLRRLPRAAVLAADDAGLHAGLLGDYLELLDRAAATGVRVSGTERDRFRRLGQTAAETGASLPALVDLYLSATWRAWPSLPAVRGAGRDGGAEGTGGEAPAAALAVARTRSAASAVLRAGDEVVAAVCAGYESARVARARAEEALRRELVDDLLTGSGAIGPLLERAGGFGLRLEAPHLVVVAGADRRFVDGRGVARDVELALREPDGDVPLVATKDGLLVCVIPVRGPGVGTGAGRDRADEPRAARIVADRLRRERGLRWRLGVSRARGGADGVRLGYEEARSAVELAERLGRAETVVHADDMLIYTVLGRDREPLAELVDRVLRPLRDARGGAGPLLATLEAYLGRGAVVLAAARDLHLSPRALTYRLERVRELTGFDPGVPDDRYVLQTALLGARLLGWTGADAGTGPG